MKGTRLSPTASARPIPTSNGTLLTDGNLGTTDWRSGYAGSQEPNSPGQQRPLAAAGDVRPGRLAQFVRSRISYMVDQSAGILCARLGSLFRSARTASGGVFGGAVISTGFDDSPDGNPTTFFRRPADAHGRSGRRLGQRRAA